MVERLFLAVPRGCLRFVIVVFPDHTHLLFFAAEYLYFQRQQVTIYVLFRWRTVGAVNYFFMQFS